MIKFKKQKLPIRWFEGETIVDAYVHKGLMVHKSPATEKNSKFVWAISHVQTGLSVGFWLHRTMKDAKEVCTDLLDDEDWMGDDIDELWRVLLITWRRMFGVRYVRNCPNKDYYHEAIPRKEIIITECIICKGKTERYALGMDSKGKYGWHCYCLECFPYDEKTMKVEGERCRW